MRESGSGKAIEARFKELQALYEISQEVLNSLDLNIVLERTLQKTLAIESFDLGVIRLLDPVTEILKPVVSRGFKDPQSLREHRMGHITAGKIIGQVVDLKNPHVVENISDWEGLRTLKREAVQSVIVVPIRSEDQVLGVIQLGSFTRRKFEAQEVRTLEAIGNLLGIAVQKARLYEETQRNLARIRALHEIDVAITSTLDLHAVLDVLLETIDLLLPYSTATIRLFNEESGLLEPVACRNVDEKEWKAEQWRGGRGIPNVVFQSKAPLMVSNVQVDPRVWDPEFFRKHGLVSYLGIPLGVKDEILGVLSFYTKEEHEFSGQEVEFLTTLGSQAAVAIHNSLLYEEMVSLAGELALSKRVKDEFLSVMSHELRTPLNAIMGYAGIMKDRMFGEINPKQEKALEKIVDQAGDEVRMINRILQATQLESGEVKRESREFSLVNFLDNLRSAYDVPLDKKLTLNWDYCSDLPIVKTDSEKLLHILKNLIDNAIKFTEKGHVTISARIKEGTRQKAEGSTQRIEFLPTADRLLPTGEGKWVEIKVADTGVGIPKQALPIIFEMFRQVDSSETRAYGGVGLGLYIVKKLTRLLGGTVEVESEPGKGSTFTVILPLRSAH